MSKAIKISKDSAEFLMIDIAVKELGFENAIEFTLAAIRAMYVNKMQDQLLVDAKSKAGHDDSLQQELSNLQLEAINTAEAKNHDQMGRLSIGKR